MDTEKKPLRNPEAIWRYNEEREQEIVKGLTNGEEVDDSRVVVVSLKGKLYNFSLIAAKIWNLCDGKMSIRDISKELSKIFDADPQIILEDVVEFVLENQERNLLLVE